MIAGEDAVLTGKDVVDQLERELEDRRRRAGWRRPQRSPSPQLLNGRVVRRDLSPSRMVIARSRNGHGGRGLHLAFCLRGGFLTQSGLGSASVCGGCGVLGL